MDFNDKIYAGPLYIRNHLDDLIRSAKNDVELDKDKSINYILINCISYFKSSGMSFDDFMRKCSTQWRFVDTSNPL